MTPGNGLLQTANPDESVEMNQDRLHDSEVTEESREYSSPACSLHEFADADNDSSSVVIYHNPACTKSRATLALLRANGVEPRIVEYLRDPPSVAELKTIVQKLDIVPAALVRRGEAVFKEKYLGKQLSDDAWLAAMVANPILIERPIVVRGSSAAIGRPPENVQRLLDR
jgi:arsenate reductase (glutaredoxin)